MLRVDHDRDRRLWTILARILSELLPKTEERERKPESLWKVPPLRKSISVAFGSFF
jgi:hypothetical protein